MNRIIYIANVRLPTEKAHGIQIMKMCQAFSMAGYNLTLVVPKRKNEIKESVWDYYNQEKTFKIEYLKITDFMKIVVPKVSFYLQTKSFLKAVQHYLKGESPDIVYSRDLLIVKNLDFENLFYEMHDLPQSFNKNDLKKVKGVIVITRALKKALIEEGMSEKRIIVAPDGVDLEEFKVEGKRQTDKKVVLYVGHLYPWKGVYVLAEAAKFLDKDILVRFIGGTEKDIEKFREKYGSLGNVDIKGHLPHKLIPTHFSQASVLVLPNSGKEKSSRYWTSPMKMFEYMAAKRPIVASDLPSIREVLNEGNAILVEPDNPKALAQCIKKALTSDDVSQKAFEDVQEYTWDKRVKKILKFING